MRIAVLVSGNGSNLQALINAQQQGQFEGKIIGVISNQAQAYALQRAKDADIPTAIISHKDYPTRQQFDEQMHQQLLAWRVDVVILAGFMRILSAEFVLKWQGKMLNIHPSLLPAYKGMYTHQRVLNSGDVWHGCTVHFVTAELDSGQAIIQGVLAVNTQDNAETLANRVHELEHIIYPMALEWLCSGKLHYDLATQQAFYHQKPLLQPLKIMA